MVNINALKLACLPDTRVSIINTFGLKVEAMIPAFSKPSPLVPRAQAEFYFDRKLTLFILSGLIYNRRISIVGKPGIGVGLATHIEQVCNRLN